MLKMTSFISSTNGLLFTSSFALNDLELLMHAAVSGRCRKSSMPRPIFALLLALLFFPSAALPFATSGRHCKPSNDGKLCFNVIQSISNSFSSLSNGRMDACELFSTVETYEEPSKKSAVFDYENEFSDDFDISRARENLKKQLVGKIGSASLLSHDEEMALGMKVQRLTTMDEIRNRLMRSLERHPSTVEWAEACGYALKDSDNFKMKYMECIQAKQIMVESNMRLVIAVAKRYSWMGIPINDLIQEGSLGLIRAVEKYDPLRGFKFSTYASWWIQQAICKSVAYKSRTIRLPVHVHNILASIRRARKQLIAELGRMPTSKELAFRTGLPHDRIQRYIKAARHAIRLDVIPNSTNFVPKEHIGESLVASDTPQPEDSVEIGSFRDNLKEVVRCLSDEERLVVILRFGLEDGICRSVSEVGGQLCYPNHWVKKVELKALRRLRSCQRNQKLKEYTDTIPSLSAQLLSNQQQKEFLMS